MNRIASAILIQMVRDWSKIANRSEILRFMDSEQFFLYAEIVNLDAGKIRSMLLANTYDRSISLRAHYRKEVRYG